MKCFICHQPPIGICAKCTRFYCSRHGGQPPVDGARVISEEGGLFCKVCQIGAPHYGESNPAASDLMSEIVDAYTPDSRRYPSSEPVLSRQLALRLFDTLLDILNSGENDWARIQIAYSLSAFPLDPYASWVKPGSPMYQLARKAASALLVALDDEEEWVRFAAAESLINAGCLEGIGPIVRLWLQKKAGAFSHNVIRHLLWWTHDSNLEGSRELDKVLAELDIDWQDLADSAGFVERTG